MDRICLTKPLITMGLLSLLIWTTSSSAADITIKVLDNSGMGLKNAIVFLKSDALIAQAVPLQQVELAQRNKQFVPDIQIVTKGTAVNFPNYDDVQHHVYSFSDAKTFELKLYSGTPKDPVVFDQEGVIEIGCNIHDAMLAWILVSSTSLFGRTDENGDIVFKNQPAEDYDIDIWHRSFPYGALFETTSFTLAKDDISRIVKLSTQGAPF